MTQREFAQGWKLLILQPWGWRYRSLTPQGTPTEESQTQLDFYYRKLGWADGEAWMAVAELYAQGEEWPPINALLTALRHASQRHRKAIAAPLVQGEEMPEAVRVKFDKIVKGATF